MLVLPTTLSLITTHHCTAACDHCCFSCTPQVPKSTRIPKERIASLIDEATEIPTLRVVVFTGGECFTLGQELDEHVARATGHGLIARCVTNGYWAVTADGAKRRVERIVQAGLKEINFSTGVFHGKWVPFKRIKHGVIASVDAGLTTVLNIEITDSSNDITGLLEDPEILDRARAKRLLINRIVWMPNEGESQLSHKKELYRFNAKKFEGCKTVLDVLTINPDQQLIACCGLHLEKIPELKLGSIANTRMIDVLSNNPDDVLKIWIHLDGPEKILTMAKERQPSLALPLTSVHPCETCLFLYKSPELKQVIIDLCREHQKDIMKRYQQKMMINIYSQTTKRMNKAPSELDPAIGI